MAALEFLKKPSRVYAGVFIACSVLFLMPTEIENHLETKTLMQGEFRSWVAVGTTAAGLQEHNLTSRNY